MSVPFNAGHHKRKGRLRTDPLYHGDECELLYHQIAALKIQCKLYADLLKDDKSKRNRGMFNWLVDQVRIFKVRYEYAYLLSAPVNKRGNERSYQWRVDYLAKQIGKGNQNGTE